MAALSMGILTKKKSLSLAVMILVALPAQAAEWNCVFATECYDSECAESGYEAGFSLIAAQADDRKSMLVATLSDPSEDIKLAGLARDGIMHLFNLDNPTGARLLSVWPGGEARYSVHIAADPFAMTYLGRCEEAK